MDVYINVSFHQRTTIEVFGFLVRKVTKLITKSPGTIRFM